MPSITELLLKELDLEAAGTRRTLEQVPEGKNRWKPHEKSMEFGYLAALVASMPGWIESMIKDDQLDYANPGKYGGKLHESTKELLAAFDASVALGRKALEGTNDNHLLTTRWKLAFNGKEVSNDTRYEAIRIGAINHLCHHRAQLGIYSRMNEKKVVSLYGPSADEQYPGGPALERR